MVTIWERAPHSVNHVFSLCCLFVVLVVSHFSFEGRTLVLIASVPGHCLPFTFETFSKNHECHLQYLLIAHCTYYAFETTAELAIQIYYVL